MLILWKQEQVARKMQEKGADGSKQPIGKQEAPYIEQQSQSEDDTTKQKKYESGIKTQRQWRKRTKNKLNMRKIMLY